MKFDYHFYSILSLQSISNLKRKREKCNKGLRHFSLKVCEKVKEKNVTSYNEVADELVNEFCSFTSNFDVKNNLINNSHQMLAASAAFNTSNNNI